MMKNDKKSKWRLLKLLLVLPIVGSLLWAFSKPVYEYRSNSESINDKTVQDEKEKFILKGNVFSQIDTQMIRNVDTGMFEEKILGYQLPGTSIVIKGTSIGTVADKDGSFELQVSTGDEVVFSFVGFETQIFKVENKERIDVEMKRSTYSLEPNPSNESKDVPPKLSPEQKEGEKPVFYIVEDMPRYVHGMDNYFDELKRMVKEAKQKEDLSGRVNVRFKVDPQGKIEDITAMSRSNEKEAKYAKKMVAKLDEWLPGKQRGKAVSCYFTVKVDFN
jgi:hypothetical protein